MASTANVSHDGIRAQFGQGEYIELANGERYWWYWEHNFTGDGFWAAGEAPALTVMGPTVERDDIEKSKLRQVDYTHPSGKTEKVWDGAGPWAVTGPAVATAMDLHQHPRDFGSTWKATDSYQPGDKIRAQHWDRNTHRNGWWLYEATAAHAPGEPDPFKHLDTIDWIEGSRLTLDQFDVSPTWDPTRDTTRKALFSTMENTTLRCGTLPPTEQRLTRSPSLLLGGQFLVMGTTLTRCRQTQQ